MNEAARRFAGQRTEACVSTGRAKINQRIAINPTIRFGKPCIVGTRISVQDVLELLREGIGFEQIIREYFPTLSQQDIEACVRQTVGTMAS